MCPPCVLFVVKSSRFLGPNTRNGVLQSWSVTVVRRGDFGRPSGASLSAGNSSPSTPSGNARRQSVATLKTILLRFGSQCSSRRRSPVWWSRMPTLRTVRTSLFCVRCNFSRCLSAAPYSRELQ